MTTRQQPASDAFSTASWLSPTAEQDIFRHHLRDKLPFVIGVTGHRDIAASAQERIEDQVRGILKGFRSAMPNTPFVVLSALADGADRLVARIAREDGIDAQVVAPLPLPMKYYEKDFMPQSVTEFRRMLDSAGTASFELPLVDGTALADITEYGAARDGQYALSGAYIAAKSHVLIALWDGINPHKLGGTHDVVHYKLEGVPAPFRAVLNPGCKDDQSDPLEQGPVYQVVTPRNEPDAASQDLLEMKVLYPKSYEYHSDKEAEDYFRERIFGPIERFNAEDADEGSEEGGDLVPAQELSALGASHSVESMLYVDRVYARADKLAISYGVETRNTLLSLSWCVGVAALCFDLSNDLMSRHELEIFKPVVMLIFPMLMCWAYFKNWLSERRHTQDYYQDYRALAEGLRVQYFWQAASIDDSVAAHYLGKQRSELSWIRRACMVARMFLPPQNAPLTPDALMLIKKHWIENQHGYFAKKSVSEHRRAKKLKLRMRFLFWPGLITITALALFNFETLRPPPSYLLQCVQSAVEHETLAHQFIMLFVVCSAIITALIHNYMEKSAIEYHAKQYNRMARIFRTAARRIVALSKSQDYAAIKAEIHELGTQALDENGDWVLTHRDRPLEVPHH